VSAKRPGRRERPALAWQSWHCTAVAVSRVAGVVEPYELQHPLLARTITGHHSDPIPPPGVRILLAAWQQARGHDTLIVPPTLDVGNSSHTSNDKATMLPNALQAGHQLWLALGRALAGQQRSHPSGAVPVDHLVLPFGSHADLTNHDIVL